MANYITVDGGTTNTRVSLVCGGRVLSTEKIGIGAGSGNADGLKCAIKSAITELLLKSNLCDSDIECILASGMITSEHGLCHIEHITLPVNDEKLNKSVYKTVIDEISQIPFVFIRGIKKDGTDFTGTDMMRGEETELFGMLKAPADGCLYILPGSHSKHISVDGDGNIVDFCTMLTGELFAAVMQHTILRYAASFEHSEIEKAYLLNGFNYAKKQGINEALFKTRILSTMFGGTQSQCYSFLLGCVLCDEVEAIVRSSEKNVVLGGQKQFRAALDILLKECSDKNVVTLTDSEVEASTPLGAIKIYELSRI